jgi:hypothetical protein
MPVVVFEPTIPVFERAKTLHDLDRATTVISRNAHNFHYIPRLHLFNGITFSLVGKKMQNT